MCPVERERGRSGCRASGLTPELPGGPHRAGSADVGSAVAGSADVGSAVAGSAVVGSAVAGSVSVGSAAASSSGACTDGATSTASRLLFSGLPSKVSSSPLWW